MDLLPALKVYHLTKPIMLTESASTWPGPTGFPYSAMYSVCLYGGVYPHLVFSHGQVCAHHLAFCLLYQLYTEASLCFHLEYSADGPARDPSRPACMMPLLHCSSHCRDSQNRSPSQPGYCCHGSEQKEASGPRTHWLHDIINLNGTKLNSIKPRRLPLTRGELHARCFAGRFISWFVLHHLVTKATYGKSWKPRFTTVKTESQR